MTRFYLGTHRARWLEDLRLHDAGLFVTYNLLSDYKRTGEDFPKGIATNYAIDSGAYTEITRFGEWRDGPDTFGGRIYRFIDDIGRPPDFVAPQDWPCEPAALAASGLTIADHQELTIMSFLWMRREFPHAPWIPVLQGWHPRDYLDHVEQYRRAGVDLTAEPLVGLGSVCRRDSTAEIAAIVTTLHALGIRLHGFGVKRQGLAVIGHMLASADSMAWSATARYSNIKLPGCEHAGPCNNCLWYALAWRADTLAALGSAQQSAFALDLFGPAAPPLEVGGSAAPLVLDLVAAAAEAETDPANPGLLQLVGALPRRQVAVVAPEAVSDAEQRHVEQVRQKHAGTLTGWPDTLPLLTPAPAAPGRARQLDLFALA